MGKLNYNNATFQDGAALTDYATRWGDDSDIVSGAFCRHCGTVYDAHTWTESTTLVQYKEVEGVTNCSCTIEDDVNHP